MLTENAAEHVFSFHTLFSDSLLRNKFIYGVPYVLYYIILPPHSTKDDGDEQVSVNSQ